MTTATISSGQNTNANKPQRIYEIWESEPAPNLGSDWEQIKARGMPYDADWEEWSYPIGNGYVGANLFGRTDTERIQITEKTLHNKGCYERGGATNFAEIYLDFNHDGIQNYRRSLSLNDAISYVSYESNGVTYNRKYFASYPDNVIAVKISADRKEALSFTVRAEIPYIEKEERTGEITVKENLLTLKGTIPFFNCNYEGQIKVLNEGGSVQVDEQQGVLEVRDADSVVILMATGTNYKLSDKIFKNPPDQKLDPAISPHNDISKRIASSQKMGYEILKKRHVEDFRNLFNRVKVNLNSKPSPDETSVLLEKYRNGEHNTWLEELMFQYGRYLLIASSREKSLPANLQGTWSQYYHTPWSGGYWHNINVQMNYWGAMSGNLSECFEAYIAYYKAYLPKAREYAENYVRNKNPEKLSELDGDNGWIVGTGANAYHIGGPGGHSGPGTGGFTSKLLMDYYLFTQDHEFLEEVAYPSMLSLSKFYSKALVPHGNLLLVEPSASPEQTTTEEQISKMPGHMLEKGHYVTVGCTFDQGFVWENYNDTLMLAKALGKNDPFLKTLEEEMDMLDPILIGSSGQIQEYREENAYSDIGMPHHRHISHLCPLFPGTLINSTHKDWMQAAGKTLDLRGEKTTGWALAHRMNCRARLKQGEKAHRVYQGFISERTVPNLWTLHPPFQIDGNFGTMAGVIEMLLQSHESYIEILPALPKAWKDGEFSGLIARGNFEISAEWRNGKATAIYITSKSDGECSVSYPGIEKAELNDSQGKSVNKTSEEQGRICFKSCKSAKYTISF